MKKTLVLLIALILALSVPGCGTTKTPDDASAASKPVDANPVVTPTKLDPSGEPVCPKDPESPEKLSPSIYPTEAPKDIHSMKTDSLVADYLSGDWDAAHPLWSEDGTTHVMVYANGYLCYTDERSHLTFYNDSAKEMVSKLAKRLATPGETPAPLPPNWQGEKVYVDLPEQKLPEGTFCSRYVVGDGTYVQNQQGVTLYRQGEIIDAWEASVEKQSYLATRPNSHLGENFLLADDQLLHLVPGGVTEVVYDHVVDARAVHDFCLVLLTLEDGILSEHVYMANDRWLESVELGADISEARFCDGVIFRDNEGKAYMATPYLISYESEVNVTCFGERTLDNLEGLWESFDYSLGNKRMEKFIETYGLETRVIELNNHGDNDCDSPVSNTEELGGNSCENYD